MRQSKDAIRQDQEGCVQATAPEMGGGLVTFDFLTPERVGQLEIETDTNVFVVRDIYSGVRTAHPSSDGSADDVSDA